MNSTFRTRLDFFLLLLFSCDERGKKVLIEMPIQVSKPPMMLIQLNGVKFVSLDTHLHANWMLFTAFQLFALASKLIRIESGGIERFIIPRRLISFRPFFRIHSTRPENAKGKNAFFSSRWIINFNSWGITMFINMGIMWAWKGHKS